MDACVCGEGDVTIIKPGFENWHDDTLFGTQLDTMTPNKSIFLSSHDNWGERQLIIRTVHVCRIIVGGYVCREVNV